MTTKLCPYYLPNRCFGEQCMAYYEGKHGDEFCKRLVKQSEKPTIQVIGGCV
jgi:hypothetical protein